MAKGRGREAKGGFSDEERAAAIDAALVGARAEAARLLLGARGLFAVAAAGVVAVAARGLFGLAGQPALALSLALALAAFAVLVVAALRARARGEHLLRDILALEISRESAPRVAVHAVPSEGRDVPLVVVQNDAVERMLRKDEAPGTAPPPLVPRAAIGGALLSAAAILATVFVAPPPSTSEQRWAFAEPSAPDTLGLRIGLASAGAWTMERHPDATGAWALANHRGEEGAPAATLVARDIAAADVRASTRCKVAADADGRACGLVFRYQDDERHHLARLDFERGRMVLSSVRGGSETPLASAPVHIDPGVWQELAVVVRAETIRVTCNGRESIEARDPSSAARGSVGLWAPAVGRAYFDALEVHVLASPPSPLGIWSQLGRPSS